MSGQADSEGGFYVFAHPSWVETTFHPGDVFEPSYTIAAGSNPRHPDYPLFLFQRSVTGTTLTTYAAVLHAAGFTVALHPENKNEGAHLVVAGGTRQGICEGRRGR